ncbi:hypothetical protein ACFWMU_18100 [Streptomyces sp. NPDC058357]|uniref:hypothetical protein n=1 Tax=unclassified Streptomyces TaxID=2593676 RepID=UPI003657F7B3
MTRRGAGGRRLDRWIEGRLDRWIEGRPYWPLDVYQGVDPSDPEALEAVAEPLPGPM